MNSPRTVLAHRIAACAGSMWRPEPQDESAVRLALALLGFRLNKGASGSVGSERSLLEMSGDERFLVTIAETAFLQLVRLHHNEISRHLSDAIEISEPVMGPEGQSVLIRGRFSWGALEDVDFKKLLFLPPSA